MREIAPKRIIETENSLWTSRGRRPATPRKRSILRHLNEIAPAPAHVFRRFLPNRGDHELRWRGVGTLPRVRGLRAGDINTDCLVVDHALITMDISVTFAEAPPLFLVFPQVATVNAGEYVFDCAVGCRGNEVERRSPSAHSA